jgi:hypothetical protein
LRWNDNIAEILSRALALDRTNPLDYPRSNFGTVAETPEFSRRAARLLSPVEHEALVLALAMNPLAGDLIRGMGGVRKLRWARAGRGKSGGVRIIYYFHSDDAPLYLLTIYGKGEKVDLTDEERNELANVTGILKRLIQRQ